MEEPGYFVSIAGIFLAALGILLAIHHRQRLVGHLSISLIQSPAVNNSGVGTRLAALITVSNKGQGPIYFGGFHAIDQNGEYCYPSCTIQSGSKLEPGQYVQGAIPAGHLTKPKIKVLWAVDGTGKKYRVNRFILKKTIKLLEQEYNQLKSLGIE
jgi:hypothetical protein